MAVNVHTFSAAGALTSTSQEGAAPDDEDPMASLPPGARVHKIGGDGELESSSSPTPEQVKARRAAIPAAKPREARVARSAARGAPAPLGMSDRRACLEWALARRGTPDEVLALARRFADFLEGKD